MTIGILGKKLGMTQLFKEDGTWVPVTVVQVGPCPVLQVKTCEVSELPEEHRKAVDNRGKKRGKTERPRRRDGYYAIQIGFDEMREKNATNPMIGHAKKAGAAPQRLVREIRLTEKPTCKLGDALRVDIFKDVRWVDVTGTSKGRGFAGGMKRHGFHGNRATHGCSRAHRKAGGLGRNQSINKGVPKGKRMAGHFGVERHTTQSLEVMKIDGERNLMFIRGPVPGHRNAYVMVKNAVKRS